MKITRASTKGFSSVELIVVVILIFLTAAIWGYNLYSQNRNADIKMKMNNAMEATRLIQFIRAAGGEEAAVAQELAAEFPSNPTSKPAAAIIQRLQAGLTVNGWPCKLTIKINPEAYKTVAGTQGWDTVITYAEEFPDRDP